jgi:hypothetical protein
VKRPVTVDDFKTELDKHLATLPDQPLIPGYTQYRRVDTNSIVDWAQHARQQRLQSGEPAVRTTQQADWVDRTGSP